MANNGRVRLTVIVLALVLAACSPGPGSLPGPTAPTAEPRVPTLRDEVVQSGLAIPWDVAFLPDGRMLVGERRGELILFESGAPNAPRLATFTVPDLRAQGESGLMGLAIDPGYARNGYVYACASRDDEGRFLNQILRLRLEGITFNLDRVLVREGMRAAGVHNGCRLVIGPDGKLWATMGESGTRSLSQDPNALNGKVLRLETDGAVPPDNPILPGASGPSIVYAFGLRNPQGLSFQPGTGQAYLVEQGPNDHDEINRVRAGANYGWPVLSGPGGVERGFIDPLWSSGPSGTLATSGGTFVTGAAWGTWAGSLMVASLKESDLRRFTIDGDVATQREVLLDRKYGRLRSPVLGPDGALYLTTSNGSGDRVIRVVASQGP